MSFGQSSAATLLLGYGYLGEAIARQLKPTPVIGVNRSGATPASNNTQVTAADILSADGIKHLPVSLLEREQTAFFLLPPSAYGAGQPDACLAPLIRCLESSAVNRVVVASSSGVYADGGAEINYYDSPTPAESARVKRLLMVEQCWLRANLNVTVVRLAGLYGPARVIGKSSVLQGKPLAGNGDSWLNLIHIDDAARAMLAASELVQHTAPLLVTDGTPIRRRHYYGELAALLDAPAPRFDQARARAHGSGRLDSRASWSALNTRPIYADFRLALRHCLEH